MLWHCPDLRRDSGSPSSEEDWLRIVTSSAKEEQLRALQRAHEIADQTPSRRMSLRRRGGWSTSEKVGPSPLPVAPAFRIAPGMYRDRALSESLTLAQARSHSIIDLLW
ncbi:hypothetical protein HPB50_029128 [Hyalomma asiaticum]|nr:hypothetical protein HPB50_029128 [Hyalomma asiaticum]